MKIFVAGGTGAIGRPLITELLARRHTVVALTRTPEKAQALTHRGIEPAIADVFDAEAVRALISRAKPEVVIEQLTALPKTYTRESLKAASEFNTRIRVEGGGNILAASRAAGVRRYLRQSVAFWAVPGDGLADEETPLAFNASPAVSADARLVTDLEDRLLKTSDIEGVVMRYGFFYGPGTWFNPDGDVGRQVREQQFPIIGDGNGVWSWLHIEDAAKATVAAAEHGKRGIYIIADDQPLPVRKWLPAFARWVDAPAPPQISIEDALKTVGPDAVYYHTQMRGVSNAKAKRELKFQPRPMEWLGEKTSAQSQQGKETWNPPTKAKNLRPILVTGAAGQLGSVGRIVTDLLIERDFPVRAMVRRDDERAEALRTAGADVVIGDLLEPADVYRVVDGCQEVYFSMSVSARYLEASVIMAAVCRELRVSALINMSQMTVSQMNIRKMTASPQQRQHWLAEQALAWSGLPVVTIRPTAFLEGFFLRLVADGIRERNSIELPFGRGKTNPVAAADVAEVVATILANPGPHIGQIYELTGPRSQDLDAIAREYSEALNRKITYFDVSPESWENAIRSIERFSEHEIRHFLTMAELNRAGRYDRLADGVQRITGHEPMSVQEFVSLYAHEFAKPKDRQEEFPLAQYAYLDHDADLHHGHVDH